MTNEDAELARIKQEKLTEMMEGVAPQSEEKLSSGKPVEVTDSTFEETIQKAPLVVVDCWAAWCGPCRMVAPIIEELAKDFAGKILFGKLNVDTNKKVATQYGIMSIPTLLVFKNQKLVDRIVGAMPRQGLEPKITRHL